MKKNIKIINILLRQALCNKNNWFVYSAGIFIYICYMLYCRYNFSYSIAELYHQIKIFTMYFTIFFLSYFLMDNIAIRSDSAEKAYIEITEFGHISNVTVVISYLISTNILFNIFLFPEWVTLFWINLFYNTGFETKSEFFMYIVIFNMYLIQGILIFMILIYKPDEVKYQFKKNDLVNSNKKLLTTYNIDFNCLKKKMIFIIQSYFFIACSFLLPIMFIQIVIMFIQIIIKTLVFFNIILLEGYNTILRPELPDRFIFVNPLLGIDKPLIYDFPFLIGKSPTHYIFTLYEFLKYLILVFIPWLVFFLYFNIKYYQDYKLYINNIFDLRKNR